MSTQPIIELKNVDKFFGEFQALNDVSLTVNLRERVVVCGPSGSGKSTMIRCINHLESHDAGSIVVDVRPLLLDLGCSSTSYKEWTDLPFPRVSAVRSAEVCGVS